MTGFPVTSAPQAAARDQAAIAAGVPAARLMHHAGTRAAALLLRHHAGRLAEGVTCWAGPGNNGGDAYVLAATLARHGVPVRVHAVAPPRSPEAQQAAREWALAAGLGPEEEATPAAGWGGIVVDGLLGTGHAGPLRDPVRQACARIASARQAGALVVALDLPTGLDATTGACALGHVVAHETVSFGTVKRGTLLARHAVGQLRVLDIGLGAHAALDDDAWQLADLATLAGQLAPLAWDAHKGTRGRVTVVGGAAGMAGAALLAAQGALRAGAGVVTALVAPPSVPALQAALPQALAAPWPDTLSACGPLEAHALAVGPGMGREAPARELLEWVRQGAGGTASPTEQRVPVVLDADALWHVAAAPSATEALAAWSAGARPVVITPHAGECARLLGHPLPGSWEERALAMRQLAQAGGVVVLLKGTPTLLAAPTGALWVMPRGTPVLATGGSGDLLAGMIATLMAQQHDALRAALLAAVAHGVAAELVHQRAGGARGTLLTQVSQALPRAWRLLEAPAPPADHVLVHLPAVA